MYFIMHKTTYCKTSRNTTFRVYTCFKKSYNFCTNYTEAGRWHVQKFQSALE